MFQMFRQNSRARARVFFMRVLRVHSVFLPSLFFISYARLKYIGTFGTFGTNPARAGFSGGFKMAQMFQMCQH
ncbi:hypothetical protein [Eikenella corrodens]|uniref:hypothetical protein n=1 Tax=Eikenella corrodens TaxID=539 RepID=UPI0012DA5EC8|nr:hypothetical protein [Eikenella corrodens]